eukprot:4242373-Pleurochrysis_carterae.AAC.1
MQSLNNFQCIHIFEHGKLRSHIPIDAVWALCYGNDRFIYVRIRTGKKGMNALLARYSFHANDICRTACTAIDVAQMHMQSQVLHLRTVAVIPQLNHLTGRCWWTALFACLSFPVVIRKHVLGILDLRYPHIAAEFRQVETA